MVERSERWEARWSALAEEVRRRLGSGAALQPSTRRRFEGQLGGDLGGVLVHRGPFAGYLAYEAGASAATVEGHVFGAGDALDDATPEGTALLGHEVVHAFADGGGDNADALGGGFDRESFPDPSSSGGTVIQRAPANLAEPAAETDRQKEERWARSMENSLGPLLDSIEVQNEAEREARQRRARPPVDVTAVADRVYRRLVDDIRLGRERGAW
jgi:hypothetical protein